MIEKKCGHCLITDSNSYRWTIMEPLFEYHFLLTVLIVVHFSAIQVPTESRALAIWHWKRPDTQWLEIYSPKIPHIYQSFGEYDHNFHDMPDLYSAQLCPDFQITDSDSAN